MRLLGVSLLLIAVVVGLVSLRLRLRLRHPAWARRSDGIADHTVEVLGALIVISVAFVVLGLPGGQGEGFRLVPAGLAVGLLTGIPFAAERRTLRARLRAAAPAAEPLGGALHDTGACGTPECEQARRQLLAGDAAAALAALGPLDAATATAPELRLRALAAAAAGEQRTARACALRAAQLDPGPGAVRGLVAAGLLLSRAGRFREGVRLLERACELDPHSDAARLSLVEALRHAGRLRDAVAALDGLHPAPLAPRA